MRVYVITVTSILVKLVMLETLNISGLKINFYLGVRMSMLADHKWKLYSNQIKAVESIVTFLRFQYIIVSLSFIHCLCDCATSAIV